MRRARTAAVLGGALATAAFSLVTAAPAAAVSTPTTVWSNVAAVPAVHQFQAVGAITVGQGSYHYHWRIDGQVVSPIYYGTCPTAQCVVNPDPPNFAPGLRQYFLNTPNHTMKSVYLGLTANPPSGTTTPAPASAVVTVTPMSN